MIMTALHLLLHHNHDQIEKKIGRSAPFFDFMFKTFIRQGLLISILFPIMWYITLLCTNLIMKEIFYKKYVVIRNQERSDKKFLKIIVWAKIILKKWIPLWKHISHFEFDEMDKINPLTILYKSIQVLYFLKIEEVWRNVCVWSNLFSLSYLGLINSIENPILKFF